MAQTVKAFSVPSGHIKKLIEKPHALCRIFFGVVALLPPTAGYMSKISFDDPAFHTYYALIGSTVSFEAKGKGIFQGNVWVRNESTISITYSTTEILV